MARSIPKVREGSLQQQSKEGTSTDIISVGTAAWYTWLEQHHSFSFGTPGTTFTARKEQRPGGRYWYAYRRGQGKLHTAYLGKSEELTIDRLNTVAAGFERAGERDTSASPVPQHNLPVQLTTLVGREQDAATVVALLRRPHVRLLNMIGTAGIGKTRLAIQVAMDLLDDFAQGVYFVSLASIHSPHLVLPAIAQTLGLKEKENQPVAHLL